MAEENDSIGSNGLDCMRWIRPWGVDDGVHGEDNTRAAARASTETVLETELSCVLRRKNGGESGKKDTTTKGNLDYDRKAGRRDAHDRSGHDRPYLARYLPESSLQRSQQQIGEPPPRKDDTDDDDPPPSPPTGYLFRVMRPITSHRNEIFVDSLKTAMSYDRHQDRSIGAGEWPPKNPSNDIPWQKAGQGSNLLECRLFVGDVFQPALSQTESE